MAHQDSTYVEVKIGAEPEAPGLQAKLEVIIGGPNFASELAEISSRIGGLETMKVYVAFQATSAASAQELAAFLTAEWVNLSSGKETESALAGLMPLLNPSEGAELAQVLFTAHNDLLVVIGIASEEISYQAVAMAEMGAEQASDVLANKQGIKFEVDFGASLAEALQSDNPILSLFNSFKVRFGLIVDPASFAYAEKVVESIGAPPQVLQGLQFAAMYRSAQLALALRSFAELPSEIRDQIQGVGAVALQGLAAVQMIPSADRRVLDKLAELTSGSLDVYATASKAVVKLHIVANGASALLKGN
jgi:hypothetical protein